VPDETLRSAAEAAFGAAVRAVLPENLLPAAMVRDGRGLRLAGMEVPEVPGRRLVAAIGKAAPGLAAAWLTAAGERSGELFVVTPHGVPVPPGVERAAVVRRGAHPYPDAAGEAAARELLARVGELGEGDLLVVLLSGGGSALLAAPEEGLALADVLATTRLLLEAGAPIGAVNTVRRQLLAAGGGGLARAAWPAPVRTALISDVPGDPLPDIASGPTVPSPTTAADALEVLERLGLAERVPPAVVEFLRGRAGLPVAPEPWERKARTVVLANNRSAVEAAAAHLRGGGWEVTVVPEPLTGEASVRGRELAARALGIPAGDRTALVFGGETTVTVRGRGRGGRNQELALAAALVLEGSRGRVLLAAGTDGIDGVTPHAGAVVDGETTARIRAAGHDPVAALADNDAGTVLAAAGDALVTGPTGTNVCDVTVVLVGGEMRKSGREDVRTAPARPGRRGEGAQGCRRWRGGAGGEE